MQKRLDNMHKQSLGKQVEQLKSDFDAWIKKIRSETTDLGPVVKECVDNIQHNYELIYEIYDKVEEIKQEMNALKIIQIIQEKEAPVICYRSPVLTIITQGESSEFI